jgi:hypothetical protein
MREQLLEAMTGVASLHGLPPWLRRVRSVRTFARRVNEMDAELGPRLETWLRHWLKHERWPLLMTRDEQWLVYARLDFLLCLTMRLEASVFEEPAHLAALLERVCMGAGWAAWRPDHARSCAAGWLLRP